MTRIGRVTTSGIARCATAVLLSTLWLFFAAAHLVVFSRTLEPSLALFCMAETMVAAFFLIRTQPRTFTRAPHEWIVAMLGTFFPLLLRPTSHALLPGADWGIVIGATFQIAGILSLNRSFALVPALRRLKTGGMYRLVRHPIYAAYLLTFCSYLAANYSIWNLLILLFSVTLMVARLRFEEGHLSLAPEYRDYQQRVKWRLIPFVF